MKFGKVLQQSMQVSSKEWEQYWVDYKLLKKIIKDCAQIKNEEKLQGRNMKIKPNAKEDNDSIRTSPDEMNFFRTLRSEIKMIGDFFVKEQAAYISIVGSLEAQFSNLQQYPMPDTKTELMKSCVSLYKELLLLENFAVMNFCGISKILKKHDKWTGYATRNKFMRTILMKQPFATYVPLLQMIDRLEHIFMKTTGCSIEQHDTQYQTPSGGEANESSLGNSQDNTLTGSTNIRYIHADIAVNRPLTRSPSPGDEAVSLNCVHALRDDARHFRETESVDVNADDGDDDGDGDTIEGHDRESNDTFAHNDDISSRTIHGSDSNAAAVAILAMKNDEDIGSTYKRKACSSLSSTNGKRKMSFATILN